VRDINTVDNLQADVEGDIAEVDGVLRITNIRIHYRLKIPAGSRDKLDRALASYAEKCPAYQSVRGCIDCTWDVTTS
jgi:uncharacterized OsmC-like protein